MALFEDHEEGSNARAVDLVEQTIKSLGIDPSSARLSSGDDAARWALRRGSASILIAIQPSPKEGEAASLRVVAPVVHVGSAHRHALYAWLLEANAKELRGAAFGVSGDEVVLVGERSVIDLDASEVDSMVRTVGAAADHYDDFLSTKFGASRASDAS